MNASAREIKRRIDDLKHAEEMGDGEDEHTHAFALSPPPSLESIREAALRLQDPELRIIEEFFWFWPLDWNDAKRDPALQAVANGDRKSPHQIWTAKASEDHAGRRIVCKHNLAVLYQMHALEGDLLSLEKTLTADSYEKLDKYWHNSLLYWEELADSEPFWSLVSARIRMLDEPRLTTGFGRRMRATLPQALDGINAELARRYIEKGKLELAQKHIDFMKETHQGLDDVPRTLARATNPIMARIRDAVNRANQVAEGCPANGANAAEKLIETTREPIYIIRSILPSDHHGRIDICDDVAETAWACSNAFVAEERDLARCLSILREAEEVAESEDSKRKIADTIAMAQGAVFLEPILAACEQAASEAQGNPESALNVADRLLSQLKDAQANVKSGRVSAEISNRANNETAAAIMHCAIVYGNKTEHWNPCAEYLEKGLSIASDQELIVHIRKNLLTARQNALARMAANGEAARQAERQSNKGFLIAVVIIITIAILYGLAQDGSSSTRSSNQGEARPTHMTQPYPRSGLAIEIDNGKARARELETQIESMDNEIEEMERLMTSYRTSGRTDDYNRLVPDFNSLVDERDSVYTEYTRLIDEVNAKVNRYNLGVR